MTINETLIAGKKEQLREMEALERDIRTLENKARGIECPLCGVFILHEVVKGVHTWSCPDCPFLGIEKY
jgi:predicted RNA-binding Zn-ribbon protein involved in translation (DUF1610 family)